MGIKDTSVPHYLSFQGINFVEGLPAAPTAGSSRRTLTRVRNGNAVPNFRTKIRNGSDATGPMTATYDSLVRLTEGHYQYRYNRPDAVGSPVPNFNQSEVWGHFNAPNWIDPFGVGGSKPDNQALVQLNKAIRDQYQAWNGGVFVAEVLQTARLLISPAKSLRNGLSSYINRLKTIKKRFKRSDIKAFTKVVADEWLEYTFGLQPLLNDTKNAAEALARFDSADDFRRTKLRGSGFAEQLSSSSTTASGRGPIRTNLNVLIKNNTRTVRRCGMSYTLSGPFGVSKDLARLCGFTLNDFVPTAWEIIPFSFVVDYFANIGQVLDCAYTDKSLVTWSNATTINETIRIFEEVIDDAATRALMDSLAYQKKYYFTGAIGGNTSRRRTIARSPTAGVTIPQLEMRVPAIDSLKWVNMAALIAQLRDFRNTPFRRG